MPVHHESVPLRARLGVAWRDRRDDWRAKRHVKEFMGMSPEQAQARADELGLRLRLHPAGVPVTDERAYGRITASLRDGVIEAVSVG